MAVLMGLNRHRKLIKRLCIRPLLNHFSDLWNSSPFDGLPFYLPSPHIFLFLFHFLLIFKKSSNKFFKTSSQKFQAFWPEHKIGMRNFIFNQKFTKQHMDHWPIVWSFSCLSFEISFFIKPGHNCITCATLHYLTLKLFSLFDLFFLSCAMLL